ncbi:ATP-binding cassette domain-containing protein, partial [Lactiplantibacillus plantarum]
MKKAVLLDVDHVSKSFILSKQRQSELILEAVSLQVQTHQFISTIGSSGVGKSTLLRMIAGIIQPSYGAITFDGNLVTAPNRRMSMVFQNFALFPWLTVR